MKKRLLILITAVISALNIFPQKNISTADPEYDAMDRENIRFDDYQILLVNHRGFVGPRQYSNTQFTSVSFLPIQAELYNLNLDFYDKGTQRLMEEDVPVLWESWIFNREAFDPMVSSFKPNWPSVLVTRDESWQPNLYPHSGTFHKE
jgi:hypothetical protein